MLAIFLDIETTGLDPWQHAVIDIAFQVVDINKNEIFLTYNRIVKQPKEIWDKHDPVSLTINGFTWEKVSQGSDAVSVGNEIVNVLQSLSIARGNAVFICQNPAFDRSFFNQLVSVYTQENLNWPYHWLDLASMYWTVLTQRCKSEGKNFPEKINLSKNEIACEYTIPREPHPHCAINGVEHLVACYQAVLNVKFQLRKEGRC
jgi:oligoribonuclease